MLGLVCSSVILLASLGMGSAKSRQAQTGAAPERFDTLVREDFFSGFGGDVEALERGMKLCAEALTRDPKNAEALGWHGSGLSFRAKRAFMAGDQERGRELQAQAAKEINDAVAMRPGDITVLIPRAAVYIGAATHVPSPEVAKRDFQVAAADFERVLQIQAPELSKLPVHSHGELLGGLAEAWHGLGDEERSRGYLKRMTEDLSGTPYSRRAKELLSRSPRPGPLATTCLGCHGGESPR